MRYADIETVSRLRTTVNKYRNSLLDKVKKLESEVELIKSVSEINLGDMSGLVGLQQKVNELTDEIQNIHSYDDSEIRTILDNKVDSSVVEELNELIASNTNAILVLDENNGETYVDSEIRFILDSKADSSAVETALAAKADRTDISNLSANIASKADKSSLSNYALKTDISSIKLSADKVDEMETTMNSISNQFSALLSYYSKIFVPEVDNLNQRVNDQDIEIRALKKEVSRLSALVDTDDTMTTITNVSGYNDPLAVFKINNMSLPVTLEVGSTANWTLSKTGFKTQSGNFVVQPKQTTCTVSFVVWVEKPDEEPNMDDEDDYDIGR